MKGIGLSGIRYNVEKANRTDGKVQNLAPYVNMETLKEAHKEMNGKKAKGVDEVSKAEEVRYDLYSN